MPKSNNRINTWINITLIVVLMAVVAIGCSNHPTNNDIVEKNLMISNKVDRIDELWIIKPHPGHRSDLTIEDIQRIIEENSELFTIEGEIDYELLMQFITENFGSLVIVVNQEDISTIIDQMRPCCRFDIKTKTIKITITLNL